MGELNDVLAEIGFDNLHTRSFESIVEMRLFRRHTLALDDDVRLTFRGEGANDRVCFRSVSGPVNLCATSLGAANKLFQILIEMPEHLVFNRARLSSKLFPVRQTGGRGFAALTEERSRILQRATQMRVR